ncbi:MAG: nickel pincer cofactor biosynthesis protein LarC [Lachnospiraceae bacterium]|nr:nickel pincer cofactor biosynthesis protein LarC [Lachnospiraceae bacterium]
MGNTLYLECRSGISGDMTVAALLDLGADQEVLMKALKSLPVQGFRVEISRVVKAGLDVCDFNVILDQAHENHDHDMEYLHGHSHGGEDSEHGHHHEKAHEHEHRGMPEIRRIIDGAEITDRARTIAVRIFEILAKAEAKAHGVPEDQVHFHEVGAVDSIVDIISAAVCLDDLDITEAVIPFLCEGKGTVRCQHGILPVPVPAVVNILEAHKIPVEMTGVEGELITPTGAAIAAAIGTSDRLPGRFVIKKTGIGAGKRSYERPSLLRVMLIEECSKTQEEGRAEEDVIYKLETNIDDCTGEALGYVMDRLMEKGARDVHFLPVYMKKNRPAYELAVICDADKVNVLEQTIFQETTTIGIRRIRMERSILPREASTVMLREGELKIKKCLLPDGHMRSYPEYESVIRLAQESGMSFQQVMDEFLQTVRGQEA